MKQTCVSLVVTAALGLAAVRAPAQQVNEYYHVDGLGSVRVVSTQAGGVIERHDYLPFGEECTTGPCAANPGAGAGQPRKFTGKERDTETGLDYFGARYYRASLGRFITVDPGQKTAENLLDPQRWNRYSYGLNNPLKNVDPDGRAVPAILVGLYVAYEIGSQIYDAYTTARTLADPNASTGEKAAATGGFLIGAVAPGGGYGTAGKTIVRKADDAARALRGTDETFEIVDGVRRAKANQVLGNTHVPAEIYDQQGNLIGKRDIPIDALRSPNKSTIDMSTQAQTDRYMRIQKGLQSGDPIPPINVTPGKKGVRVEDVKFDATGQQQ